ncbi:hypothetical protein ACFWD1_31030, partial [Micromonospora chalcea]
PSPTATPPEALRAAPTAATAPAATTPAALAPDARISLRAHVRHTGALVRRNLLWIRQDPESMFDALLMPVIFVR